LTRGGVPDPVEVLQELPVDKNLLCLVVAGGRVQLELWVKTRRRKSPYDRCVVARMHGPDGDLAVCATVSDKARPFLERVRKLMPAFQATAVVEVVNSG
jgi:hypothetical protein